MPESKQYIKVGELDKLIPVNSIYAYIYEGGIGKTVLRMYIDPSVTSYDELHNLLVNNTKTIYHIVDEPIQPDPQTNSDIETIEEEPQFNRVIKAEYTNYFGKTSISYNVDEDFPDQFFIEIIRKTDLDIITNSNTKNILDTNEALCDIFEMLLPTE